MQIRTALACGLVLLPLISSRALGDVVPPEAEHAADRMKDPKALDRADSYCADKAIGAVCHIPGNAFEGGGAGKCDRRIDPRELTIDLLCMLDVRPEIDRGLAPGPYRIEERLCRSLGTDPQREVFAKQGLVCDTVPTLPDRFCAGRSAGSACSAEMRVAGKSETQPGVCRQREESVGLYFNGRYKAVRNVLQCEPAKPTPEPVIRPIGLWRKLFG